MKKIKVGKSQKLYEKAKRIIPGGTQLLSKRPEMFLPDLWPSYYKKAKGNEIWDLDGKVYEDFTTNGIGACVLGYANERVDSSVKDSIDNGSLSTLNSFEEVELAELLISLHPWASRVRFAKTGGEACSIAIRIARAAKSRDVILFCGYHGWHDWYLSANLNNKENLNKQLLSGLKPKGVPNNLVNSSYPFLFNDIQSLREAFDRFGKNVAAIIMEPVRYEHMEKEFVKEIFSLKSKYNSYLIFDEITSGFRENLGGIHMKYDIEPDMVILGKALGNGYPISAIVGKEHLMKAAEDTFISSTFFTERIGFVAALETIKLMDEIDCQKSLMKYGAQVKKGWKNIADSVNLKIRINGIDPLAIFSFTDESKNGIMQTIFTQEMLKRNYLASSTFYSTCAFTDKKIDKYLSNALEVFELISDAYYSDKLSLLLEATERHSGFERLN